MPKLRRTLLHGVIGHQVGDQEHALLRHQLGRLVVDEIAVLDGAHAVLGGAHDGFRRIGVGADVAAESMRLLHRRLHLGYRELQAVERVVGRGHAARHHDLDVVGALPHLLARGLAHLIGTVGRRRLELQAVAADARSAHVRSPAAVGVAASRPDRLAGDEHARPDEMPRLDGRLDAPVASARIAHRREAAIDHGPQPRARACGQQRQRHRLQEADVDLAVHHVHVRVDQARHHRAPAAIDDRGVVALDRLVRQLLHLFAFDEQLIAAPQLTMLGLEQLEIA